MATREFGIGEAGRMSESTPEDEARAEQIQPTIAKKIAKCPRCHQNYNARLGMSSSRGTVCPDCYESLED